PRLNGSLSNGPTVVQFFREQYLPYVKSYKRSWNTDESIIRNHILPALGERPLDSVRPPDIALLMESMRAREYAPGTINRVLVLLRYGFTLALRWQVEGVECNPVRELIALKEDNKIERFLTREETVRLLKATQHSDNRQLYPIVFFLLRTGARKREALDAKWRDIDWRQRSWRIPRTKSGKVRHVPLSSGALSL